MREVVVGWLGSSTIPYMLVHILEGRGLHSIGLQVVLNQSLALDQDEDDPPLQSVTHQMDQHLTKRAEDIFQILMFDINCGERNGSLSRPNQAFVDIFLVFLVMKFVK